MTSTLFVLKAKNIHRNTTKMLKSWKENSTNEPKDINCENSKIHFMD